MGRLESAIKGLVRGITFWKEDHEGCDNGTRLLLPFGIFFNFIIQNRHKQIRSSERKNHGEIKNEDSLVGCDIVLIIS